MLALESDVLQKVYTLWIISASEQFFLNLHVPLFYAASFVTKFVSFDWKETHKKLTFNI